jgi:hypothetical protein
MTKRQMTKPSPPTLEQIAQFNGSAEVQLADDIVKLVKACEIDHPRDVAHVLCFVLIQYIMAMGETTFPEATKIAIRILKNIIKHTRYIVREDNAVIDLRTNQEVSPGGLKQ